MTGTEPGKGAGKDGAENRAGRRGDEEEASGGSSLSRSGGVVGAMTFLSRVLGFVRDQTLAVAFGAGAAMDVFLVAFKIPNFLRRLFGEGAFAQAFVPVFTEYRETRSRAALVELAANVSGTLALALLVVTTLGVAASPLIVMLFAPGFIDDPVRYELAVDMLRLTFPYLFFVCLLAYAGSMLNTFGRFAVPSFTPVLLNLALIAAALLLAPHLEVPIMALAWGVLAAGVLQLALQLPFLARLGLLPRPRWGAAHEGVRRILRLMAPAVLGSSVAQINLLLDTVIASFLVAGSLSWLYYGDRLMEFPLGLLGVTLGTVILPRLSRGHTLTSEADFRATLDWALRLVVVLGLPAALALALFAEPLIATLFEYGEFTADDTRMTGWSLLAYASGLPAFLAIKVLAPAFFARQDTRTPVRIGIVALISNMLYNVLLVVPMVVTGFVAPHTGLALATSLSAWQQALTLYRTLARRGIYRLSPALLRFAARTLPSLVALAAVLLVALQLDWHDRDAGGRALLLLGTILLALCTWALALLLGGVRPRELASPRHA